MSNSIIKQAFIDVAGKYGIYKAKFGDAAVSFEVWCGNYMDVDGNCPGSCVPLSEEELAARELDYQKKRSRGGDHRQSIIATLDAFRAIFREELKLAHKMEKDRKKRPL